MQIPSRGLLHDSREPTLNTIKELRGIRTSSTENKQRCAISLPRLTEVFLPYQHNQQHRFRWKTKSKLPALSKIKRILLDELKS